MQSEFNNLATLDYQTIQSITDNQIDDNMIAVGGQLPPKLAQNYWDWVDAHGGDSDQNIIVAETAGLPTAYHHERLWDTPDSYGFVAQLPGEEWTIVGVDKHHTNPLVTNYILVPFGTF